MLRDEYEKYSKLAEIEAEKARPLMEQIELTLGKGKTKDIIINITISLAIGLFIFLLGIWFGPRLTLFFAIKS